MNALLIVGSREGALGLGMNPVTRHHKAEPAVVFWWHGLDRELLRGVRPDILVLSPYVALSDEFRSWLNAFVCRPTTLVVDGPVDIGRLP